MTAGGPHRRDFLAARTTSAKAEATEVNGIHPGPLFSYSANAMGCEFQVLCPPAAQRQLASCVGEGFELIARLEQQLSIFRESSEMSRINRLAGQGAVCTESWLLQLLQTGIEISRLTRGAFDMTAAPLSELWRECRRAGRIPSEPELHAAVAATGTERIQIDHDCATIEFAESGVRIDLGAIGKGFALDRLGELFAARGVTDFLIHGGQSSVLARGVRQRESHGELPWRIGISHPLKPATRLGELIAQDDCIGTSGCGRKSFVHAGQRYGHVIDPRTGWPADHWLSVTVIAADATTADALATALLVMSPEDLETFSKKNPDFGILALREGSPGELVAVRYNIAADRLHWLDGRRD